MNKKYYSYNNLEEDCNNIVYQLQSSSFIPDEVWGIARGGLIPASMICYHIKSTMRSVYCTFRDGETNYNDLSELRKSLESKKVLLVDDMTDSGVTLKYLIDTMKCNNLKTSCLLHNVGQKLVIPDFYGRIIDKTIDDPWIVFPWEDR